MDKRVPVKEEFLRSTRNPGALVNVDAFGLENYRKNRINQQNLLNKVNEINTIKEEVSDLKSELSDIKSLLIEILEKSK